MSSLLHVLHVLRTTCPLFFLLHVLYVLPSSRTTEFRVSFSCTYLIPSLRIPSSGSLLSSSFLSLSSFLLLSFLTVSSSFFGVPYHLSLNSPHNLSSRGPVEHERRPAKTLGTEDDIRKQLSKFFQLTAAITY